MVSSFCSSSSTSENPQTNAIQPADIKAILEAFGNSLKTLADGRTPPSDVPACILVTNRPLSPNSPRLIEIAKAARELAGVDTDNLCDISEVGFDFGQLEAKVASKTGLLSELEKIKASTAPYILDALTRFHVCDHYDSAYFRKLFESFATTHGAFVSEIRNSQLILVGKIMEASIQGFVIEVSDFVESVTDSRTAVPLIPSSLGQPCRADVDTWSQRIISANHQMIDRYSTTMIEALESFSPVIAIVGPGGCGKSLLLVQGAKQLAEASSSDAAFSGFVVLRDADMCARRCSRSALSCGATAGVSTGQ